LGFFSTRFCAFSCVILPVMSPLAQEIHNKLIFTCNSRGKCLIFLRCSGRGCAWSLTRQTQMSSLFCGIRFWYLVISIGKNSAPNTMCCCSFNQLSCRANETRNTPQDLNFKPRGADENLYKTIHRPHCVVFWGPRFTKVVVV
jgi:hypothetical protein